MDGQDDPSLMEVTFNERLFHVGILDQWDAAVTRRDRQEMIAWIEQVQVSDPNFSVGTVIAHPKAYGF